MTDKYQRLRDALAAGPTLGPWIHLFGDRFIYTRLEDGCRGTPVVGVDYAGAGNFPTLKYIAEANPDTIAALLAERDRLRDALEKLARLGNGDRYGNSDGNMIARDALAIGDTNDR